ncbi:MAG: hypothetical protein ACYS7M_13250 [Planctomycetota bacterium]|jgi:hypothetical protein
MKLSDRKIQRWALLIAAGAVLAGPAMAEAAGFRFRAGRSERVWVPPVYQERVKTVWIEPVYEVRFREVWVPPVYRERWVEREVPAVLRTRKVARHDRRGRVAGYRRVKAIVRPARTIREKVTVKVRDGHYQRVKERVLVRPGHEKVIRRKVLIREGYYTTRHRPGFGRGNGFSVGFSFRT